MQISALIHWYEELVLKPCLMGRELRIEEFVDRVLASLEAGSVVEVRGEGDRLIFRYGGSQQDLDARAGCSSTVRMICTRLAVVLGGSDPPLYGTRGSIEFELIHPTCSGRFAMENTPGSVGFRLEGT
jgi:hypothetical protein